MGVLIANVLSQYQIEHRNMLALGWEDILGILVWSSVVSCIPVLFTIAADRDRWLSGAGLAMIAAATAVACGGSFYLFVAYVYSV